MWRTVIISTGERLSLKTGKLKIEGAEQVIEIPIEDLYSVIIENEQASASVSVMNALTGSGTHVIFCDSKHLPVSVLLPLNTHYRVLNVLRKQILMPSETKDALWDAVIKAKIENQARVLRLSGRSRSTAKHLLQYKEEVIDGDRRNREGLAAKMFFRELFGTEFIRFNDDAINAALNYGYAIIRSAVSKTLVSYGFNCAIGIHHIGEYNPFNLADDLMEALRPSVDYWVCLNNEELLHELTKKNREGLVSILNRVVLCDGKRMRLRNAIDRYVKSFVSSVDQGNASQLKPPLIIDWDIEGREVDD